MYAKSPYIFYIISIITLVGIFLFLYKISINKKYVLSEYEQEVIDYFKEIALNTEYDSNPQRVIKWNEPMVLYIYSDGLYSEQTNTIKETILNINKLFQDGFKIEITDSLSKSNSVLYLCKRKTMDELRLSFMEDIDEEYAGLTSVQFSWEDFTIRKAEIFIDVEESWKIQTSSILEELTQSIGLMNDSEKYRNSIFYKYQLENNSINSEYSEIDIKLIELLYNSKMKPGMDSIQSQKVITSIFAQN